MRLFITILVGVANAVVALVGLYTQVPRFFSAPGVQNATSLIVVVLPFAATSLFALGRRTRSMWAVAASFNLLALVAMVGLIALSRSAGGSELITGFALAGVFSTANLAFLVSHVPTKGQATVNASS